MSEQLVDINSIKEAFKVWDKSVSNGTGNARQEAMNAFELIGFPGARTEDWKYTNLQKVLKKGFAPTAGYEPGELPEESFKALNIPAKKALLFVFVDGYFNENLSDIKPVQGLSYSFLNEKPEDLSLIKSQDESLISLNTAFAKDGLVIEIEEKATIELPIEVYNITTCPGYKIIQPKHQIKVGSGAVVTFIESYHNLCVGRSFTNTVVTMDIAKDAVVNYMKLEHPKKPNTYIIDSTVINQASNSTLNLFTITLSGALIRNNLFVTLNGEHVSTNLFGLYMLKDEDHVDNKILVDHAKPNCFSNQLYKGILDEKSTGVFNGKIIVREDAQKTNAYQNNRNILVSDDATINTKPQLEIYADDVKCSHGATSAQIEDKELFYLRSRGIGKEKARALLMSAFAAEIWQRLKNKEVKRYIQNEISHLLGIENETGEYFE